MADRPLLATPPNHGDVLVWPRPTECALAARRNAKSLRGADRPLAGRTLSEWRRIVRRTVLGDDEKPIIVTGHQPEFIHPGVWAKHIVADRLAAALGGSALHLVVDSDVAKDTRLRVPAVRDHGMEVVPVAIGPSRSGILYEQIPSKTDEEIQAFEKAVRSVIGDRYDATQLPAFLAALTETRNARDWVDQMIAGRQAIESEFGIQLEDRRISRAPWGPLLAELVGNAERFAGAYNRALKIYRQKHRVRSAGRPIPDLASEGDRVELPVWAFRGHEVRRRLFVRRCGPAVALFAEQEEISEISRHNAADWAEELSDGARINGWELRPRALMLTLWARLLLGDLFIHGIGGAKYDRITDAIIGDYFDMLPPGLACVSATLHLGLPCPAANPECVRLLTYELRDMLWNPQRHLSAGNEQGPLVNQRAGAVQRIVDLRHTDPRNHRARAHAFREIQEANKALLDTITEEVAARRTELETAIQGLGQYRMALHREYFFGLFDRTRLEQLLDALPAVADFRV